MTDTAIEQAKPPSAIELLGEEFRRQPSIELAQQIVALQTAMDNHSMEMEKFQWEREQRQDEIDFGTALSACQAEIGRIQPNVERKLKSGATMNWFADYPHLDSVVRPIYIHHGFAISFSEDASAADGFVIVKAILSRGRISREYVQPLPIPEGNQATTSADLRAAASSRAMRYLLIKIFNIAVGINQDEMGIYLDEQFEEWIASLEECATRKELYDRYEAIKAELLASSRKDKKEASAGLFDKLQQLNHKFTEKK